MTLMKDLASTGLYE